MLKTKGDIRKEVRARKRELSPLVFSEESRIICNKLTEICTPLNTTQNKKTASNHISDTNQTIVAYWPMADEIDISPFLETTYKSGSYRIFLPVITGNGIMEFRLFEGRENMAQEPQFGIWEPTSHTTLSPTQTNSNDKLIIIVPGVAFTPQGDRLGRGRGFYDRMLTSFYNAHTIGVCLSCQIYDEIPTDPHDQRMDLVLAPNLL